MYFLYLNKQKIINYKITFLFVFVLSIIFQFNLVKAEDVSEGEITKESVINLVNLERSKQGINQLKENEILNKVAQSKLNNMIEDDYFAHTSPKGVDPWKWFAEEGYRFEYAGENLATSFFTAKSQHQAWMESLKHKKNILDDRFTDTGVAVGKKYVGEDFIFVTVQVFGTPEQFAISSPNFTPQTFEVPEKLFYENVQNKDWVVINSSSNEDKLVMGALEQKNSGEKIWVKLSAWFILVAITFVVIITEFKFFTRKKDV